MPTNTLPSSSDFSDQPAVKYQKVWSATDSYYLYPKQVVWDEPGSRIVFTNKNHTLANSDSVNLVASNPATAASSWIRTGETITLIDANSFSVPQLNYPGPVPGGITPYTDNQSSGYINTNQFSITCMKYSKLMFSPKIIQLDTLPGATTVIVEAKVHPDAAWVTLGTYTSVDGNVALVNTNNYLFVRGRRSVGTGQPVMYAMY